MGGYIGATLRIQLNLYFLQPTRVHNPNGKSIGSAVSAHLTAESRYTLEWSTLSPKIAPSRGGSGPPSNSWFPEPDRVHNPNGISIGSAVFTQVPAECHYTLQWAPLSPKITPSHWGSGPLSNRWFLGPIQAHKPNGISVGSAVFTQVPAECHYTLQWAPLSPKITPSHWGSGPHLTDDSLGPSKPINQTASPSVQLFCTDNRRVSLYFTMVRPFPSQNCRFP